MVAKINRKIKISVSQNTKKTKGGIPGGARALNLNSTTFGVELEQGMDSKKRGLE